MNMKSKTSTGPNVANLIEKLAWIESIAPAITGAPVTKQVLERITKRTIRRTGTDITTKTIDKDDDRDSYAVNGYVDNIRKTMEPMEPPKGGIRPNVFR